MLAGVPSPELSFFDSGSMNPALAMMLWCAILALHVALHFHWHAIDRLLDVSSRSVMDPDAFRTAHRIFLRAASLQWLLVVILTGLTLHAWQHEKRAAFTARVRSRVVRGLNGSPGPTAARPKTS